MQTSIQKAPLGLMRADFVLTLRLALPLIVAEVGWMCMGIVDTIMVGRLPDSAVAIGATGLGQSLYHSVAIFGGGLLLGLDTFVSHAYGREDLDDARHSLANGLFLAIAMTPILMLAVSFWPAMMTRFGISTELVGPMRPFLRALNWGTPPLLAYFALRRYLQAVNVAIPIMFALISANIVNLVGDWALIYGHLGFRAMGITGSGWSTCFARIYMAGVLMVTLIWVESRRSLSASRWAREMRIDFRRMWALLRLGAPAATQILLEIGAFSGATAVIARLGPVPLSGHEIALNCAALAFMVPLGISSAAAVRVGQQLGRKDPGGRATGGVVGHHAGRRIHVVFRPGVCFFPNLDCAIIFAGPAGDSDRRSTLAGGCRIPTLRRIADGCDRGTARLRRHEDSNAGQLRCVLADWTSRRLRSVLQIWLGRVWRLDRTLRWTDDYRVGASVGLA